MTIRKVLSLGFGIALSGAFLWLVFRSLPFRAFFDTLKSADVFWIMVGFMCFGLGYACRIWRWRLMLSSYNEHLSWRRCSVPFMVSIAGNNVLPFRAGDVLRCVAFSKWLGVSTARVLATLLVERLLDLLSLIVALAVALSVFSLDGSGLQALFGWSSWAVAAVACAIALILLFPRVFEPAILWMVGTLPGCNGGLTEKLSASVRDVFATLASLAERTRMAMLIGWSFLAWAFEAGVFYAVARALPDITEPITAWVAMPVGTLSTMLPSTPGYIGTFHYFVMQAAEALGNPKVAAAAFAFLVHLTLFISATLWGCLCFVYWVFKRNQPSNAFT